MLLASVDTVVSELYVVDVLIALLSVLVVSNLLPLAISHVDKDAVMLVLEKVKSVVLPERIGPLDVLLTSRVTKAEVAALEVLSVSDTEAATLIVLSVLDVVGLVVLVLALDDDHIMLLLSVV